MPEQNLSQAIATGKRTIQQEIEALQALQARLGDNFWQCARLLCDCPGMVWTTAVGTSATVAERFAHILTCSGGRSMFLSTQNGLHGHTLVIQPGDVLIAMSRGGESREVNQMVEIANSRQASTVAFVHDTTSTLARTCQYVLPIHSPQEFELAGYLATTSTVAFSAMCDALCSVIIIEKGFDENEFGSTHPGGAVGGHLSGK
ncbi:MAG: SIS domain-containing protein [Anaerolineales bacterium]